MIHAFRIFKTSRLKTAFEGRGSKLAGGRWNFKGHPVVYCAGSLSLAALEILANMEDYAEKDDLYSFVSVEIPETVIETVPTTSLPKGWDSSVALDASRNFGTDWILEKSSVAMRVPSVIIPGEWNYLLNPAHQDFGKLKIGKPEAFALDARLRKK